jgi:hypothetical protein
MSDEAKRATKVIRGLPHWLYTAVNAAYRGEIRVLLPQKSGNRINVPSHGDVEWFLFQSCVIHPSCGYGVFDHVGHDSAGNMISELYAATCEGCQKDAELFATRIGARYSLTNLTYHAPELPNCVRMTFFKVT